MAALSQGYAGVCNPSDNIFYKIFLNLVKSLITLPYPGKVTITLHPKGEKKLIYFPKSILSALRGSDEWLSSICLLQ